jgi:hypothetical protein
MLSLTDRDAVLAALTSPDLDANLRALIGLRIWQADTDRKITLEHTIRVVIVQPGDPPEAIHAAVGFPICWDQADQPGWACFNDHGGWFELGYRIDGCGVLVFVPDDPDTNDTLRFNCLGVADRKPAPAQA